MRVKRPAGVVAGSANEPSAEKPASAKKTQAKHVQASDSHEPAKVRNTFFAPANTRPPTPVATKNAQSYPDIALRFSTSNDTHADYAAFAVEQSLLAVVDSGKRRAAKDPNRQAPSLEQALYGNAERWVTTHASIVDGSAKSLVGLQQDEIERRQALSRALLTELGARLYAQLDVPTLLHYFPRASAALFIVQTPESQALLQAALDQGEARVAFRTAFDQVTYAHKKGMGLSSTERALLVKLEKQGEQDPQAGLQRLATFTKRAEAFLAESSEPAPDPSHVAALLEQADLRVQALQSEIKDAPTPTLAQRFRGSMLGLAIGDALGGPMEFVSRADLRAQVGKITDMVGGGWLHLQPGEYTDDTQMAVAMAESIVSKSAFDIEDVGARYVEWLNTDPKDVGGLTRQALELKRLGLSAEDAGTLPWTLSGFDNAGNGSVMRAAPVALLTAFASENEIEALAMRSSLVTHADPRATYGAAAIALGTSLIIRGEKDVLGKVATYLESREPRLAEALLAIPTLAEEELSTSGYVVDTVQAAFWAFYHATDYVDGITRIINLGEDTDTAGATAGILLGAKFGELGIPKSWRDQLQNRPHLEKLAEQILELAQAKKV